jgi:hypothetical protein
MVDVVRRRAKRRALHERLRARVPGWYSPAAHLVGNGVLTAGLIALFAARMGDDVRAWAWLFFPLALLVGNGVEYLVHRYPMHKRTRRLDRFFQSHTLVHHRVFDERDFDVEAGRDVYFVLTTVHTTALSLGVLGLVYAALLFTAGPDVASITSIGLATYAMAVELMHLVLHLPERWFSRWPLRWSLLRYLREHHRRHHDPKLMTRYNFNLAFPVTDFIVGTRYQEPPTAADVASDLGGSGVRTR